MSHTVVMGCQELDSKFIPHKGTLSYTTSTLLTLNEMIRYMTVNEKNTRGMQVSKTQSEENLPGL